MERTLAHDHIALDARAVGAAAMTTPVTGSISEREAAVLRRILAGVPTIGAETLLDQVRMLTLAPGVSTSTCRIYLLHPECPRSCFAREGRQKLPGRFTVHSPGGRPIGEFSVWVEEGHLRALQYVGFTDREPLTFPPAEWMTVEPAEAVEIAAPQVASAGPPWYLQRLGQAALAAIALCCVALLAAAFLVGRSRGADLDDAQQVGARVGAQQGAEAGRREGTTRGMTSGRTAGQTSGYGAAYGAAVTRARASAYRATLMKERQARVAKAAAAAAQAVSVAGGGSQDCAGYRDARGYWICS